MQTLVLYLVQTSDLLQDVRKREKGVGGVIWFLVRILH